MVVRPKGDVRVYLVGDNKVGKTTLLNKYYNNESVEKYERTRQAEFKREDRIFGGKNRHLILGSRDGSNTRDGFDNGDVFCILSASD